MINLLSLLLALVLANAFEPEVRFEKPNGLRLLLKDEPTLLSVKFEVQPIGQQKHTKTVYNTVGGFWEFFDPELKVESGGKVHYKITANYEDDVQETGWILHEFETVKPIRSMKRAVVFRDEYNSFNKGAYKIDCTAWGGGNNEFQVYTPDSRNLYTQNGHLYLKPTLTTDHPNFDVNRLYHGRLNLHDEYHCCTFSGNYGCDRSAVNGHILNPIMSGKVTTNANILYGSVKVRAKIPKGDWLWPAIWMLPVSYHYGGWPRSGEIDMMESRGNTKAVHNGNDHGVGEVASTLHWGPDAGHNAYYKTHGEQDKSNHGGGTWADAFHEYRLDWTATHIRTYVDNIQILDVPTPNGGFWHLGGFHGSNIWAHGGQNAPFDHHFHLILNNAVGGAYFPSSYQYDHHRPWTSGDPWIQMKEFYEHRSQWLPTWHQDDVAMLVDYVEMTQY